MALDAISIRKKLILTISLFFALILLAIAAVTYSYFRYTIQQLILTKQFDWITNQGKGLDDSISLAHDALISAASVAPEDVLDNPYAAQKWLENRTGIRVIFDNSLTILDTSGKLVATVPAQSELSGASFSHWAYLTSSMSAGKPFISEPFLSVANGPAIMMTAPIKAKDGSIRGLLCGVIELLNPDGLFGTLRNARIGSSGYLYLFSADRTIIVHPDATRILKQDVKPGANVLFDAALKGFEGSGETINSKGVRFLASFKRLETTGWILAANYPLEEAYQPIIRFRNYYLLGVLFVLLSGVAITWRLGISISRPMESFTRKILALAKPGADRRQRIESHRADELGMLAGAFDRLLDEVERRELELSQAMAQADAANHAKTMFLASISHELRTPMNGVLGMLELVNKTELKPGQREHIELAYRSARNLLVLLNDLLDFSKIEAGKMELDDVPFELREVLTDAFQSISVLARDKGLSLDLQIEELVPRVLKGDAMRLRQVILNLLGNALKFTQTGGVKVGVVLEQLGTEDAQLGFSVSDTGPGIPQDQQRAIFDAFTQADTSTTRQFGGTGLGLAISSRLVSLMEGQISVDSQIGQGSVFRFSVRLRLAHESENSASSKPLIVGERLGVQENTCLRILLVEDNLINQKVATGMLINAGHIVKLAQNGEEAVAQATTDHFDIILMDIEMPRLDGFGATQAIRARGVETPIIALTAHAVPGFREKCMGAGMMDFMTKPINSQELHRKLAAVYSNALHGMSTSLSVVATGSQPSPEGGIEFDQDELPILDVVAALDLADGDQEMVQMMLPIVLDQIATDRRDIALAVREKDLPRIKRTSHRLKGSVGQVGAGRAQKSCALLEAAAAANDRESIVGLFEQLEGDLDLLAPAIVEHLAK